MRALLLLLALTVATPAIAQEVVPHTHQLVEVAGYHGVFHFEAVEHPVYTCPLHPAEVSSRPFATCPRCHLDLEMQNHSIGLEVTDAEGRVVKDARVWLEVTNQRGFTQKLELVRDGYYRGSFALRRQAYDVKATLERPGQAPVAFQARYSAE